MSKRQESRAWVMQYLYENLVQEYNGPHQSTPPENLETTYIDRMIEGIFEYIHTIDKAIESYAHQPLNKIDAIELSILRLSSFEILFCPDIPNNVSINEATDLCKRFGSTGSHKFINATLDAVAKNQLIP